MFRRELFFADFQGAFIEWLCFGPFAFLFIEHREVADTHGRFYVMVDYDNEIVTPAAAILSEPGAIATGFTAPREAKAATVPSAQGSGGA